MPSTRDIRRRIRSVTNIAQVTKAMEAVSAAKMRKAQDQVMATRPYAEAAAEVLTYIARIPHLESELNTLIQVRPVQRVLVLLITADRGLAGGFNANVIRRAATYIRERRDEGVEVEAVSVGRKGRNWFLRYDPIIRADFTGIPDSPRSYDIDPITRILVEDFTDGQFDEVVMVYTKFVNTVLQEPVVQTLLPIEPAKPTVDNLPPSYLFEPSPEAVLNQTLYGFIEVQVMQAIYESIASEHSARMVAMHAATDAANELIDSLTLTYNKARQEAITNELMDIIGGSVAQVAA
ncbi:MAG: ATP synthase F1 subunit gamma [Caldilineaceae bacterium]